jgi:hypothetical protein
MSLRIPGIEPQSAFVTGERALSLTQAVQGNPQTGVRNDVARIFFDRSG